MEGYGSRLDALAVRYEIAVDATAPALISDVVAGRRAADDRMIFAHAMATNRLPPGPYVLRVTASSAGTRLDTIVRRFDVAPRVLRRPSTPGAGATPVGAVVLPIDQQAFGRPFRYEAAVATAALKPFRDHVPAVAAAAFDAGVTSLKAGDYPKAEASLKRAIRPDVDSTAAMVYLAVTYAASGHDLEAAAVWETALTDGSDFPQIYDWLADSLLRLRRLPEARAILEEALGKWPKDTRFTWPLANLYAGLAEGAEALNMLERHLTTRPDDLDALQLGVEWIYEAHASGAVLRGAAEDVRLARAFANAYTRAVGPRSALVAHWVAFLERDKR
jgi:tetratricopeptide (TPR) repeat protein